MAFRYRLSLQQLRAFRRSVQSSNNSDCSDLPASHALQQRAFAAASNCLPAALTASTPVHEHGTRSASSSWLTYAGIASGLAVATTATCYADASNSGVDDAPKVGGMVSLKSKRRIFFLYEKRIRAFSAPKKLFDYFASKASVPIPGFL